MGAFSEKWDNVDFRFPPPSDDLNDEDDFEVEDDNNEPDPIIAEELRRGQS
ncbi:hypothetical protein [Nocardia salmonicida]|uniref:hypothetical protein n=1 Tax=Nocardia salmonicida TaxID=53431 RepID=UPI002E27D3EB|nr:hypothetical protein [Nocardia salmonicida]